VLFADPTMHRDPIQVACLTERNHHFVLATRDLEPRPEKIWGRRSVFYLSDKPLLVSEIFLPEIRSCKSL
jgi:chorismate--pyruvate lyase